MRFWKIIAIATASELAAAGFAATVVGLGGLWGSAADVLNALAPLWLIVSAVGGMGAWTLTPPGRARRLVGTLGAVGVVLSSALIAPEALRSLTPRPAGVGAATRVVSFNTWSENADPDAVAGVLRRNGADVIVLIEMPDGLRRRLRSIGGLYPYVSTRKGACQLDLLILSKRPFSASGCERASSARIGWGTFDLMWGRTAGADGAPLTIATTHYTWPVRARLMAMQRRALIDFVCRHPTPDLVVTGDFNLAPWTYALKRQDAALRPLVRSDRAAFTWPAYLPKLAVRAPFPILPIDHIYAGPAWRTTRVRRLPIAGSDHYGLEATLVRVR